jgi:hypothetical protein
VTDAERKALLDLWERVPGTSIVFNHEYGPSKVKFVPTEHGGYWYYDDDCNLGNLEVASLARDAIVEHLRVNGHEPTLARNGAVIICPVPKLIESCEFSSHDSVLHNLIDAAAALAVAKEKA